MKEVPALHLQYCLVSNTQKIDIQKLTVDMGVLIFWGGAPKHPLPLRLPTFFAAGTGTGSEFDSLNPIALQWQGEKLEGKESITPNSSQLSPPHQIWFVMYSAKSIGVVRCCCHLPILFPSISSVRNLAHGSPPLI